MALEELQALIARHAGPGTVEVLDGVQVSAVEETVDPSASSSGSVMALIAQGAKTLALGERIYDYLAGEYLVSSVDLPVVGSFTEASPARPALGVGLTLEPTAIAELLLDPGALGVEHAAARAVSGLQVSTASPELIDALVRLLRLVDRPRDQRVLLPMAKREILWLLISGEQVAAVRQLGLADSSLNRVNRTIRWMRDHYAETIRIEDLADLAAMSQSAFHRNFQAVTAMSPLQFLKQVRLQEARMRLLTRPGDVAGAGFEVGYESASQFTREYRRQFGLPPGQDAARLRTTT